MIKSNSINLARRAYLAAALGLLVLGIGFVLTQPAVAQGNSADDAPLLSSQELTELVGPIALYPDDLIGIVLPASTYPLQVVQAARLLADRANDSSLQPDGDWDDSVVALLNYPDVLKLMNDDLDWTWELGEAVLNQRAEVLDSIQGFRDQAYAAGNLRSDDRQVVNTADGVIAIAPADPQVIYVPYYEPERVIVYQTVPVYHYYPRAYPVYYYPYPADYAFRSGFFFGVTSAFSIGWHSHFLHVHNYGYSGHPYYGRSYYDPFYVRRGVNINVNVNRGNVWEPRYHPGARPFARSDGRRVNNGSSNDGRYRGAGAPETRSFTRSNDRSTRDSVNTAPRGTPNNASRERRAADRPGAPSATGIQAAPRTTTPRNYRGAERSPDTAIRGATRRDAARGPYRGGEQREAQAQPSVPQQPASAPEAATRTPAPRGMSQALRQRSERTPEAPATRADSPRSGGRAEGAPRTIGRVATDQPRYRNEAAPSSGGGRSQNRSGAQGGQQRDSRSESRHSTR